MLYYPLTKMECSGKGCAWWCVTAEKCAVTAIAEAAMEEAERAEIVALRNEHKAKREAFMADRR